jgi:O-antigen biosynthesis protein
MDQHHAHRVAPGIDGWLESPLPGAPAADCLIIAGWAFARPSRIVEVWATGLGLRRFVPYGLRRDDVAAVYLDEVHATHSGFNAYIECADLPRGRIHLEIWATLDDGRSVKLFTRELARAHASETPGLRAAVRHAIDNPSVLLTPRSWINALTLMKQWWAPARERVAVGAADDAAPTPLALLAGLFESGSRVMLPRASSPRVSVVIVVWNRAELSLKCLKSLAVDPNAAIEVIVVDNASTDATPRLLERVDGVTVVRNSTNVGFTAAANAGARTARAEYILFLNNDAVLAAGAIQELSDTATRSKAIGAVGGKLVFPDGRLQEAGSIIWSDGSCEAYGRGGDPDAPEYNFERDVDFCSGALLLTRRDTFETLGGFDERYRPAYYEDADYCARLWAAGFRVVYQPKATADHEEFGSAASLDAAIDLQRTRRGIFVSRHAQWLSSQSARTDGMLQARSHPHGQPSMLFIDDAVPDPAAGAGFPRAAVLVSALAELGFLVTMYVTGRHDPLARRDQFASVEVVAGGTEGLRTFLATRSGYGFALVSRPHNMQHLKTAAGSDLSGLSAPCIYDAEAIYALRELGRMELAGGAVSGGDRQRLIEAELDLTRGAAAVLAVSERERMLFAAANIPNVSVLAHAVRTAPTATPFGRRRTILFVGAFSPGSPNEDAVQYFCREVLPALRGLAGCDAPVVIAGARMPPSLEVPGDASVSWRSDVEDLTSLYNEARVFVAPTRFAAGIPLKVIEAAARGVPIVGSPLVASQLGWLEGDDLLTGADATEFAQAIASLYTNERLWLRLRESALARVDREYNETTFRRALRAAIDLAMTSPVRGGPRRPLA